MIIYRAIFLNSITELNLSNFGCHWTKDESYPSSVQFTTNDISKKRRQGTIKFIFKTRIKKSQINISATIKSNEEFPDENECVLNKNSVLNKITLIFPKEYSFTSSGNTGTRCEKWVK